MNGERSWDMIEANESFLNELAELGASVSGKDCEIANTTFLKWQYFDNPAGNVVIWVARDRMNSRLAGGYSVIPLRMKIDNKDVIGSLSMNTMTHPDYRKQGIFKALAEKTFESCRLKNIPLTIGLPNANSYPGFTGALKFKDIGSRCLLIKPFNGGFVVDRFIKNDIVKMLVNPIATMGLKLIALKSVWNRSSYNGIKIVEVVRFGKDFDDFWNRISPNYKNIVIRDSKFLNWRFADCPTRKYVVFKAVVQGEMAGYVVVLIEKHHSYNCLAASIVDLIVDSNIDNISIYGALLSKSEEWAVKCKADFIGTHVPPHLESCNILMKLGYINIPKRFIGGSQSMIVRPHLPDYLTDDSLMDFSNWFLMDGDNDRP